MRSDTIASDVELDERRAEWRIPSKEKPGGSLGKYAAMATSASTGAILKWRRGGNDHNMRD
jgi:dihydroxyacid dehydratase/phosphogluconate dehydratase